MARARLPLRSPIASLSRCCCGCSFAGASGWKSLLGDGDTGWHIRTGQYILAHHAVPTRDLFSFSKPDAPWFAWEWLSGRAVCGCCSEMAGLKAIVLFAGAMIALYATVLLRFTLWMGANALVALTIYSLAVGASSMHFLARPHLFTLVALPCSMWLIQADARHHTRARMAADPLHGAVDQPARRFYRAPGLPGTAAGRSHHRRLDGASALGPGAPVWRAACRLLAGILDKSVRDPASCAHRRLSARRLDQKPDRRSFKPPPSARKDNCSSKHCCSWG